MNFAVDPIRRAARAPRLLAGLRLGLAGALLAAPAAVALAADAAPAQEGITEELIRLLVKHNALPRDEAENLIRKLQAQTGTSTDAGTTATAAAATPPTATPGAEATRLRVIYVPDAEKQKMQAEIERKVMDTARNENWARPDAFPDWLERIALGGDLRLRYELDRFDGGNSPYFIDYNAINRGSPYDTNPLTAQALPPILNTTEDRSRARVRARIDLDARISPTLDAGFRFATGSASNPVSTNQTMGTDANKTSFVVDRAYLQYRPAAGWSLWAGRMPSPWLSTELVWDDDLNFDGLALQYRHGGDVLAPFATLGAFPVQNTDFDFPSRDVAKGASRDKWLYGLQLGADWRVTPDLEAQAGIAYYHFHRLEGETSSPLCPAFTSSDSCDSDHSRPGFMQKGNTLFALRDLGVDVNDPNGPQYQYFGLASPFRVIDLTASVDLAIGGPLRLRAEGAYVVNLGYDRSEVRARSPVNNYGANDTQRGGDRAFIAQFRIGHPAILEYAQWDLSGGYRWLESDAVVDAFTDSDFHLGGTNTKGFHAGGRFGLTHNAWLGLRWLSSTEISGAPLAVDVLQLDFNARF